jgi:YVTN family beta-propeller protein
MFNRYFYPVIIFLLLVSCEKPPAFDPPVIPPSAQGGIFILNEGGFNNGNASLGYYSFTDKTLTDDVFYATNNRHLGDVLQSMTVYNGIAYLVVNNSKKVELMDMNSFQSAGTINGFTSPRYLLFVNPNKAYVSDLYDNAVAVVDMTSRSIVKKIPCPGATEQMKLLNNKVYVCNTLQKSLYIIDPYTDQLTDSIPLSYGPNSLVLDQVNKLWVLCSGDKSKGYNAALYRIDPWSDSVERSFTNISPDGTFGAEKLSINGTRDRLYWLNADVQSIGITDSVMPSQPFVHSFKNIFYGLGVDSVTGEVYVSDAIDFVQKSTIYIYSPSGGMKAVFKGGIITNGFYYYYK